MQLNEVCTVLSRLERDNDVNQLTLGGYRLWPLIRYCLWSELIQLKSSVDDGSGKSGPFLPSLAYLSQAISVATNMAVNARPGVTSLFISHPANLQKLSDADLWFDRIVDPLFFLARNRERVEKLYVAPLPAGGESYFPFRYLRPLRSNLREDYSSVREQVGDLYRQAGLAADRVEVSFAQSWKRFTQWNDLARRFFRTSKNLKRVYLANWYFPEMMGIIAAARDYGITVIDIQHGKQGRYQAMYSWWTCIPLDGYHLMPDLFWCWGVPSCEHILASSPDRPTHRPVVGGFPWPDFYRKYLAPYPKSTNSNGDRYILVTLQGPVGGHTEPIPDFILEYMKSAEGKGHAFVFRGHPNFVDGLAYCAVRLRDVPQDRYLISNGNDNLYDQLLTASHHITAFSSCCYEAEMLGVPTLLFGAEAQATYADEIQTGRFAWTSGNKSELESWLKAPLSPLLREDVISPYIVASLPHTDQLLQELRLKARHTSDDLSKEQGQTLGALSDHEDNSKPVKASSFVSAGMGALISQLISLACLPLLTRLYSPSDFAPWALGFALVMVIGALTTLRYDLAVVVERDHASASAIFWLMLIVSTLVFMSAVFAMGLAAQQGWLFREGQIQLSIYLVGLWLFLVMVNQIWNAWHLHHGDFFTISLSQIANAAVMNSVQIYGAVAQQGGGFWLVLGSVCGQLFVLLLLWFSGMQTAKRPAALSASLAEIRAVAWKYRRFPQYSLPFTFFGALRDRIPVLLLGAWVTSKEIGFYSQAWRLSSVPAGLLGSAIRPVLFHQAADIGLARLEGTIGRLLSLCVLLGIPLLAVMAYRPGDIFAFLLGERWRDIGPILALLAFPALVFSVSSWMDRLLDAAGKQHLNLWTEIASSMSSTLGLVVVLASGGSLLLAIATQSAFLVLNYLFFIYLTYRVAGYDHRILYRIMFLALGLYGGMSLLIRWVWP